MSDTPELHRPVRIDELPQKGKVLHLQPSGEELAAIAQRLDLVSLNSFEGELKLRPEMGRQISLRGPIRAEIVQTCVVTGETLSETLNFEIDRKFAEDADPMAGLKNTDEDIVTDPDIDDPDPIIDGKIDVGEQAVEELALNIPPYPRVPGAAFEDINTDPEPDSERENPFSALAALKDQINSKD